MNSSSNVQTIKYEEDSVKKVLIDLALIHFLQNVKMNFVNYKFSFL